MPKDWQDETWKCELISFIGIVICVLAGRQSSNLVLFLLVVAGGGCVVAGMNRMYRLGARDKELEIHYTEAKIAYDTQVNSIKHTTSSAYRVIAGGKQ